MYATPLRKVTFADVHGRPLACQAFSSWRMKVTIAPVHPDFCCETKLAVPDGFCWLAPRSLTRTLSASSGAGYANHGLTCHAITA